MAGNITYSRSGSRADRFRSWFIRTLVGVRADLSFALVDAVIVAASYTTAVSLRLLDQRIGDPETYTAGLALFLPVAVVVHLLANMGFGAYGHVWQYASISEAKRVVGASVVASILLLAGVLVTREAGGVQGPIPLSSMVLAGLMAVAGMGLVRFRSRLFSFKRYGSLSFVDRVLVVGAEGDAARVIRGFESGESQVEIVGRVALDAVENQRRVAGMETIGVLGDLPRLVEENDVDSVVVAADGSDVLPRRVVDLLLNVDVGLRIVPMVDSIMNGSSPAVDVRDLELSDLL